jgi:mono/diheme cytochrome c family protein
MQIRRIVFPLMLVLSGVVLSACGGGGEGDEGGGDGGNLPACPSGGSTLTYDNFGKKFFQDYCVSCHFNGTTVNGAAPYDSLSAIQGAAEDIYGRAADTNTNMPKSGAKPTDAERQQLGEWLSCGAK